MIENYIYIKKNLVKKPPKTFFYDTRVSGRFVTFFLDQEKCVQGFYRESGLHLCISLPMCGPQNVTVI